MLRALSLFCAVLTVATGQTTQVSQCTSNEGPLPINTYIEGCITPPCQLPQEQDAVINVIFKAPHVMRNMQTLATAYLQFGPIVNSFEYDLGENKWTCNFLANTYCPVVQGEVIQYTLNMYIERSFPAGTQLPIEFRIVDDKDVSVWCIRVPVRIVRPVNTLSAYNATLTDDV